LETWRGCFDARVSRLTKLNNSTIRDIPDHQEVLLLKDGQCSIVIEIVERAAPPTHPCTTDMEALDYHYRDMTSNEYTNSERNNGEVTNVWHKDRVRLLGLCVHRLSFLILFLLLVAQLFTRISATLTNTDPTHLPAPTPSATSLPRRKRPTSPSHLLPTTPLPLSLPPPSQPPNQQPSFPNSPGSK